LRAAPFREANIEPAGIDALTLEAGHEAVVDVQPDVAAASPAEVAAVQGSGAAAALEHGGTVWDLVGDERQPDSVVAAVEHAHQQLVAASAAVDEAGQR